MTRLGMGLTDRALRAAAVMIAGALLLGILIRIDRGGVTLAHAEVERSSPSDGETLQTAPEIVEVWFTQEIASEGTTLTVYAEDGTQVDVGNTTLDLNDVERRHVTVSLQPNLARGVYTVEWQSASVEDGDTEQGSFTFTIAGAECSAATPAVDASPVATPTAVDCAATPTAEEIPEAGLGTPVTAG